MIKEIEAKSKDKMNKTLESFAAELSTLKAGRANPHMLDKIRVDYYGTETPISQVAALSAPEPRTLLVQPWDASLLKEIEKAIMASDLGLNPSNDGKVIRLMIPQLTEERRKELVKVVHKTAEEAKVAMRNVRRGAIDDMKKEEKAKKITEDDMKDGEKSIQKLLDEYIEKIDDVTKKKEKEILTV
jgi:ribosome recycling factor